MSEIDERSIAEMAKQPPRSERGPAAAEVAREVLAWQALMRGRDTNGEAGADG